MNLSLWTFRWKWSPVGEIFSMEGQPSVCLCYRLFVGGIMWNSEEQFWDQAFASVFKLFWKPFDPVSLPYPSSSTVSQTWKKSLPSLKRSYLSSRLFLTHPGFSPSTSLTSHWGESAIANWLFSISRITGESKIGSALWFLKSLCKKCYVYFLTNYLLFIFM